MTLSQAIRRAVLPAFRRVNAGDVTISHHWTGDALRLHSFRHKGYWWYGRGRERESMELFARLVPRGSVVLEVGAHIGYVGQYFSMLTGPAGQVFCFEPSPENLPYLRENAAQSSLGNICVVEAACGKEDGTASLYYERITGQNSTVSADFTGLEVNSRFNGLPAEYETCPVRMRSLDSFVAEQGLAPSFVKIDAEGGERDILRGMIAVLARRVRVMVEVNTHREDVFEILNRAGYLLFDAWRRPVLSARSDLLGGNIFALHESDRDSLAELGATKMELHV